MTEKEKDPTLGCALIVGPDRLHELKRLLPQLKALDQIVVVNTSGQKAISNFVKKQGRRFEVYEDPFRPTSKNEVTGEEYALNDWGFARARNVSLQKLRTDYAFWIDTDDILGVTYEGKDRTITAEAVKKGFLKIIKEHPEYDVWFADYHYSYDEHFKPNVVHARERLFKNPNTWKVVYPIHECFVPDHAPKYNMITDIKFIHIPSGKTETSSQRNMRMLQDWLTQLEREGDEPDIARCRLQIGQTYWGLQEYRKAADWLENVYLANHPRAISLEQWQACAFAAKSYVHIGNLSGAERMALKAITLEPALPDGYYLLAEVKWLAEEDPHDILQLIDYAARCDDPPPQVIKDPNDYVFLPNCIISACKFKQGQYEVALDFALKALRDKPNDERAEKLRAQAAEKLRIADGTKAALAIYQLLRDYDEHEKAAKFIANLPYQLQHDPEVLAAYEGSKHRVAHLISDNKYEEYFTSPPHWKPTPWDGFEKGFIPGRDRYEYILSRLKKASAKRILIVGCDDGYHGILLAKEGFEVQGIDLNEEAIRIANERAEKLGVPARFRQGWFEKLNPSEITDLFNPLASWSGAFDAVIASEQIEKVKGVELYLEGLGECLKPGGIMVLTTPDGSWEDGDIPYSRKEGDLPPTVRAFDYETLELLLFSNKDNFYVNELHFLPYSKAYKDGQGWLVAELVKGQKEIHTRMHVVCGDGIEPFTPLNLEDGGIGGSETAVIQMAYHWNKLGAGVVVYRGDPNKPDVRIGVFDGVHYRYYSDWSPTLKSDIFIAWRLPHLFAQGRPDAKKTVLWNHDIHYPIEVKPEWLENIDVITVLSEWHRDHISKVHGFPQDKIWITRNGIDPARFLQQVEKKKHHYFFTSSHDRGLDELLAVWPKIKEAFPEAKLHVGYGTHTAAQFYKDRRDIQALDRIRAVEQTMYEMEGIEYHQRLNQWELAKIQMECEFWLYPYQSDEKWGGTGGFPETYCITALEAMAAKAIPFTRLNAALPEVVKHHIEWTKDTTDEMVIKTLTNPKFSIKKIEENYQWAMSQTWSSLAEEWLKKLRPDEEEVNVVQDLQPERSSVG